MGFEVRMGKRDRDVLTQLATLVGKIGTNLDRCKSVKTVRLCVNLARDVPTWH
jgi:hypothetical protein